MKHRITLGALAAAVLLAYAPVHANAAAAKPAALEKAPAKSNEAAKKQFWALADEYYDAIAKFDPVGATQNGDNRFDDQLGTAIWPESRAKQFDLYRTFTKRLQAIPRAQLNRGDRISYDVMAFELKTYLAYEPFPEHLLPIEHMSSMPVTLANFAGGDASQPLTTVKEYEAYLSRLSQLPAWIDQAIANMKEGMAKGITQPKAIMVAALPQFQKLVSETPEKNIYFTPVTKFPASFSDADKQRLAAAYRATVADKLNPALAKLSAFEKGIPAGLPHQHRLERPAERRRLVQGAHRRLHHHQQVCRRNPPDRPARSSAHPGRIRQAGTETGLQRPGSRLADLGLAAAEVLPVQD